MVWGSLLNITSAKTSTLSSHNVRSFLLSNEEVLKPTKGFPPDSQCPGQIQFNIDVRFMNEMRQQSKHEQHYIRNCSLHVIIAARIFTLSMIVNWKVFLVILTFIPTRLRLAKVRSKTQVWTEKTLWVRISGRNGFINYTFEVFWPASLMCALRWTKVSGELQAETWPMIPWWLFDQHGQRISGIARTIAIDDLITLDVKSV